MDLGLKGKRALITGASRGIGAATAFSFASEGCDVVLAARDGANLEKLQERIQSNFPGVAVALVDIDMRASQAIETVATAAGAVDILINNAGDVPAGNLLEIDEQRWRAAWDLKIFGYINLSREIYRQMVAKNSGVIVNVVGTTAENPQGHSIAVASGNAALIAFTRALGGESVRHGVRVVAVNPGPSETDRQVVRWKAKAAEQLGDAERWRELVAHHPFGRLAKPAELADVITFLASDRAGYISGTSVTVDGGGQRN